MKLNNLVVNDPWMLAEDIPNSDLFFAQIWLNCFVRQFGKNTGWANSRILCRFEGYHLWFYFGEKDSFAVGDNIANRIVNEDGYAQEINDNIIKQADKLRKFCQTIPQTNLSSLSNSRLWSIYETHNKLHQEYYTWCWIPVAADMFHNNLTNRVKDYLSQIRVPPQKMVEIFIALTQPTKKSLIFIEQQDLLKVGVKVEENNGNFEAPSVRKLFQRHWQKYHYTKFLWVEGEYKLEDYRLQLRDIMRGKENCRAILKRQNLELRKAAQRKKDLIKNLPVSKRWKIILENFGDFMVTKIYRRYAQIFAMFQMDAILKEIARRLVLTPKQVRFMLPSEVKGALLVGRFDAKTLLERTKKCVYYIDKQVEKVTIGKEAEKLLDEIATTVHADIKELRGDVACPGFAQGKVKIIIRASDMQKMEKGDILVSIATDPDIVPAMKKAAAIVTEQGGVTSHAAIVSRELGIPCVIGTKIATKVLKDGDLVEVDANKGIIKIL